MKRGLTQRIFYGEYNPAEDIMPSDPSYRPLSYKIGDEFDYFSGILSGENRGRLSHLKDMISDAQNIEMQTFYWGGFADALLLIYELFGKGESKR